MAGENEPAKPLLPYLQRADELQKHEPLVAYYCRLYAMDRGMKISQSQRTKTTNALLASLIKQLEKDKKSLTLGPEDNLHLEGFALSVFAKADKQDRAGRADLNTAKTLYAASIFFEILNQFGPVQPDIEQKQKYAAWKAADIRKALKEGRTPVPGPPAGDDNLSFPSVETLSLGTDLRGEANSSPQSHERLERQHNSNISGSPSGSLPPSSFPIDDFHQLPPPPPPALITRSDSSVYSSQHNHHELPQHQQHLLQNYPAEHLPGNNSSEYIPPQNYPSEPHPPCNDNYYSQPPQQQHLSTDYPPSRLDNDNPPPPPPPAPPLPPAYPNFQSYTCFNDSTLPSVPTHEPSYYKGSETSFSSYPSAAQTQSGNNYAAVAAAFPPPQYAPGNRNETVSVAAVAEMYQYDCNYQPLPEMIAEAHKAARFAVGALAFDEVPIAVEHLRKALELLTNPSLGQ